MARYHYQSCQRALSGVGWDPEGTHEEATAECQVHQKENNSWWDIRGCWTHPSNLQATYFGKGNQHKWNGILQSDRTGLPVQSSRGNTSLMVYYDVDANYIDAEPLRNHADNHMIPAYQKLWARTNSGRKNKPNLHILDNEASEAFKSEIKKIATCSWYHLILPAEIWQRELSKCSKAISSQFWRVLTQVSQWASETGWYLKWSQR
jgi:hypothetical protein